MAPATLQGLQSELGRCPFHDLLQLEALRADTELTAVRLPFRPELGLARDRQAFHGGVVASLVDVTAHAAVALSTGAVAPTIDLRIDYLQLAQGPYIIAEATILRAGGSVARADVQVKSEEGVLVACGRGTFSTRPGDGSATAATRVAPDQIPNGES